MFIKLYSLKLFINKILYFIIGKYMFGPNHNYYISTKIYIQLLKVY